MNKEISVSKYIEKFIFRVLLSFFILQFSFLYLVSFQKNYQAWQQTKLSLFREIQVESDSILYSIITEKPDLLRLKLNSIRNRFPNIELCASFSDCNQSKKFLNEQITISNSPYNVIFFGPKKNIWFDSFLEPGILILVGVFIIFSIISLYFIRFKFNSAVILQMESLSNSLADVKKAKSSTFKIENELNLSEWTKIENHIKNILSYVDSLETEVLSQVKADIASQVAHDIRSPLSALNMVLASTVDTSEDRRLLMRNAIQRINDIANELLRSNVIAISGENNCLNENSEPTMLVALLEMLVSEKRSQYKNGDLEIVTELKQGYGLFAKVNSTEFSRIISNLINNAVEAIVPTKSGKIVVSIESHDNNVFVKIKDNGKGIPSDIIEKLGKRGHSFGKNSPYSGSGLGLFHAKENMKRFGGDLRIESILDHGTSVVLILPKITPPNWFVEKLTISSEKTIVSIDDDNTIHQIWKSRIKNLSPSFYPEFFQNFTSTEAFEDWFYKNQSLDAIFLVDYEFLGRSENGLDIIRRLNIVNTSILVTSRFDEPKIKIAAEEIGLKILPKGQAAIVPIEMIDQDFRKEKDSFDNFKLLP